MAGDPLATYRARRDFRRSPEPEGLAPARGAGARLSFVVQKHDATRMHQDLRLELGGVLRSWAVTRRPSLDPADKRLAEEVEDHPLEYGRFEGRIAEGYGAGTVMLWDRGTWTPASDDPEAGRLRFRLDGERLRGGWHLVRMRSRGPARGARCWRRLPLRSARGGTWRPSRAGWRRRSPSPGSPAPGRIPRRRRPGQWSQASR
ncbi:DNA polymerase ligase N-terminal domain-containing protein [Muricoccus vinaceus]|uniref:DNA polymerase ligase N-terminal domain-containing protein n=1 Tax=Muricoccus vinaceus TaxID=424704 RepID=A0ABV6IRR4_9PROT